MASVTKLRNDINRVTASLKYLWGAFSSFRWHILALTFLGFFSGLLEGIGVNAVIPMFSFVVPDSPLSDDVITRGIETLFRLLHLHFNLVTLLIFIAVLFTGKAILLYFANYINAIISANYEYRFRSDLFRATMMAHWPYLLTQRIGHLEKIIHEHVNSASNALMLLSSSVLLFTSLLVYIGVAINISLPITLITLCIGGVLFLLFKPLLYKTRKVSEMLAQVGKEVSHYINEHMIGIKTVKSMASEEGIAAHGETFFRMYRDGRIALARYNGAVNHFFQPISIVFILVLFALMYREPSFNFASFAVILYLIQKIFSYFQAMQGKLNSMGEYAPYLRSVVRAKEDTAAHVEYDEGKRPFHFTRTLQFRNVSFSYEREKGRILNSLSFSVRKGEMIGIIGPSGAGKTTVVDLLLRLFTPDEGEILVDDEPIDRIALSSWRTHVGYVSQDIFLLNDTIEKNISFYDTSISHDQVMRAAHLANIHAFIMSLPNHYATMTGERGVMLSAGQRQRVILARILARNPQLLILDEATSALDNESEIAVQQSIESLKGNVTVIAIAHRLSTLVNSDRILVVAEGAIREQGSPQDLMGKKDSYFYKTYTLREGGVP